MIRLNPKSNFKFNAWISNCPGKRRKITNYIAGTGKSDQTSNCVPDFSGNNFFQRFVNKLLSVRRPGALKTL